MQETKTKLHPVEEYLRNPENPKYLSVRYLGKKRRLFIIDRKGTIYMFLKGSRKKGYPFLDINGISKVYFPTEVKKPTPEQNERNHVLKCKREAAKATFTNPFIRACLIADELKSAYDNKISGGSVNSGKIISLDSIAKVHPWEVEHFRRCLKQRTPYRSSRIPFRGYEMTLCLELHEEGNTYTKPGDIRGYLNLEYKGCLNGYYYVLINDDKFIGYDKD